MFGSRASKAIVCWPPMFQPRAGPALGGGAGVARGGAITATLSAAGDETGQHPRVARICRLGVARLRDGISSA